MIKRAPTPRNVYTPTAQDIAAACQEIQQSWTEDVRRRRRFGASRGLRVELPWYHVRFNSDGTALVETR